MSPTSLVTVPTTLFDWAFAASRGSFDTHKRGLIQQCVEEFSAHYSKLLSGLSYLSIASGLTSVLNVMVPAKHASNIDVHWNRGQTRESLSVQQSQHRVPVLAA